MIRVEVPFPPSTNRLWRYDPKSKKMVRSLEYRAWIKEAGWVIKAQRPGYHKGYYKLTVRLVRPVDGRHRDLDNRIKSLSDAIAKAGIVLNDRLCEQIDIRWVKSGPPCCVWISDPDPLTD